MLSRTLKMFRENCGYTQQQVAETLNIDRSTYAYYETGKTTPDVQTLMKLARIFGVNIEDILADEDTSIRLSDSRPGPYRRSTHSLAIYELSKAEKQLISYFRLMEVENQKEVLRMAHDKIVKQNSKE